MAVVKRREVTLHYEVGGDGARPWLVLSGALGTNLHMWDSQMAELEKNFRVLRYDMRGHGESSTPAGPYSIGEMAEDVVAIMDGVGISQAHFCGLSIGGAIGQWMGIHHAERLGRLILSNTAAKLGTREGWDARIAKVEAEGMASISEAVTSRWFTADFARTHEATVLWMRQMLEANNVAGYAAAGAAIRDMDLRQDVARIKTPTCVVAGEFDMVTTEADAEALVSTIKAAMLEKIPAAHISSVEAAEIFTGIVLRFLTTGQGSD